MKVSKGAVGEEEEAGVEGEGRVGEADPMEDEGTEGMVARFNEGTHRTHSKRAREELNIKTTSTTFWIILNEDHSGNMVSRGGGRV